MNNYNLKIHELAKTLAAILTLADEDPKNSTSISSLDLIDSLRTIDIIYSKNYSSLSKDLFRFDPFQNRYFDYIRKECIDTINSQLHSNTYPFSPQLLFKNRIIPQLIELAQQIETPLGFSLCVENLILLSTDEEMTLQHAYQHLVKTSRSSSRIDLIKNVVNKIKCL